MSEEDIQSPRHQTYCMRDHYIPLVSCIIKTDLKLKFLKKEHAQELTQSNWFDGLQHSRKLWKDITLIQLIFMWFSDEKLFTWKVVRSVCTIKSKFVCWPNYSTLFSWIVWGKWLSLMKCAFRVVKRSHS